MSKKMKLLAFVVCIVLCATMVVAVVLKRQQDRPLFAERNIEALTSTESYSSEINSDDCYVKDGAQCLVIYITPNGNNGVIYLNQYPKEP
ncbi:MAG: hypothetical protein J6K74_05540 [Marinifilaceae bacterium]|nr:hypothetical protein [Marinifilaceae bacterium]